MTLQLKEEGLTPAAYLKKARAAAKRHGYKEPVEFADDGIHKLMMRSPDGRIHKFGRVGYGDFIIYSHTDTALAESKQRRFHASHTKIKGDWAADPYSPNNLALRILW